MTEHPSERCGHGGPGDPEHGAFSLHETAAPLARVLGPGLRLLVLAVLLAGYAAALLYAPVRAEGPRSLTPLERRVALHHARVSANEAGFDRASDSLAIWQTLENIAGGRDAPIEELDAALNEHCGRMTGARPHRGAERGNHRWSRDLDWSGREPARWAELNPQLPWHFYRERWRLVLARSVRLVRERPHLDVCAGEEPITWGGRRGLDAEVLARRNAERERRGRRPLVELRCSWRGEATFNGFYGVERGGRS